MKIDSILVKGIGKKEVAAIARRGCDDPAFFHALDVLSSNDNGTVSDKATWVMSTSVTMDGSCGSDYFMGWIERLNHGISDSVAREYMRGMLAAEWNEEVESALLSCCEGILQSQGRDIGVYYNALRILNRLVRHYPDLSSEISTMAARHVHSHSVGIRALAKKIVKKPGFVR